MPRAYPLPRVRDPCHSGGPAGQDESGQRAFARHLRAYRDRVFTFLRHDRVDATNWRAEHALRPAMVNRKVRGGSRTWAGACAEAVLMSFLPTAALLKRD